MINISIVILNYFNYWDTVECVDSIISMKYQISGIVIVDNNSKNESYLYLRKKYKRFQNISVIRTKKNLGFAKGNNVGIHYAKRKYESDFIMVVNNDTVFKDDNYFNNLLQHYEKGIGIIGSQIMLKDGSIQNRMTRYITLKETVVNYINLLCHYTGFEEWAFLFPKGDNEDRKTEILHGCALLFTPDFFRYYKGFYPRTFLYGEEIILYLMCKVHKLKQFYVGETYLFHKENQSTKLFIENCSKDSQGYYLQSYKWVIWWIIKSKLNHQYISDNKQNRRK